MSVSSGSTLNELLGELKLLLRPRLRENQEAYSLYNRIRDIIMNTLSIDYEYMVELEGSLAKDTNIGGETDLDIFILVKKDDITNSWIKTNIIRPLRNALTMKGFNAKLRYSSHPYINVSWRIYSADIVPAYWATNINDIKTAVDRTPFHTKYVVSRLKDEQKDEVRLLKKFLKGVGVYGAEIKTSGFSGYLCELLIIKYGTFINSIKSMASWKPPQLVIIEDTNGTEIDNKLHGVTPLVVPDPVDLRRNAAAAVSLKSFETAVLAAKLFLTHPSRDYLFPRREAFSSDELSNAVKKSGRCPVIAVYRVAHGVAPDVLWGELRRVGRKCVNVLKESDFKVIDVRAWSNEGPIAMIFLDVLNCNTSVSRIHIGPYPHMGPNSLAFIYKYVDSPTSIGPWVGDDGRLYVVKPVRYTSPTDALLSNRSRVEGKHVKLVFVARSIDELVKKVIPLGVSKGEVLYWLTEAVFKRPPWLTIKRTSSI